MSKLLIANWKMNPATEAEAVRLARGIDAKNVVICPPFVYLESLSKLLKARLGAQDVFWENKGAFTGEVSPAMLKNSKAEYVIIGHSERRKYLGETDEMVNKKVAAALMAELKVILCVGDDMSVRKKGPRAVRTHIQNQIAKALRGVPKAKYANIIFTYEPSWAISTSHSTKSRDNADTPENAVEMIRFIKTELKAKTYNLKPRMLYGGSITSKNAAAFLRYNEINGALVGGASLNKKEFKKIIKITQKS